METELFAHYGIDISFDIAEREEVESEIVDDLDQRVKRMLKEWEHDSKSKYSNLKLEHIKVEW